MACNNQNLRIIMVQITVSKISNEFEIVYYSRGILHLQRNEKFCFNAESNSVIKKIYK